LIEEQAILIDENGAPRGPRHFLVYNPPLVDESLGLRRSALLESNRLVEDLLQYNIQTIVFGRSRRSVEILLKYLREHNNPPLTNQSNIPVDAVGRKPIVQQPCAATAADIYRNNVGQLNKGYEKGRSEWL